MIAQKRAPGVCDISLATQYRKILVALDRVGSAPETFANALNIARAHQSQLLAFHCISYSASSHELVATAGMGFYIPEAVYFPERIAQEAAEELTHWLEGWQDRASDCGLICSTDRRVGDPGREICAAAKQWDADLIVIGRRDRSSLEEFLLGSVSNYVMHHAPCSVLIVNSKERGEKGSDDRNG